MNNMRQYEIILGVDSLRKRAMWRGGRLQGKYTNVYYEFTTQVTTDFKFLLLHTPCVASALTVVYSLSLSRSSARSLALTLCRLFFFKYRSLLQKRPIKETYILQERPIFLRSLPPCVVAAFTVVYSRARALSLSLSLSCAQPPHIVNKRSHPIS